MRYACCLALALAACASPSPRFLGTEPAFAEGRGHEFAIYQRGSDIQALRVDRTWPVRQRDVFLGAVQAIEAATGCTLRPRSMRGDAAIVEAEVACPGR
jgi:hypothetical protein